MENNDTGQDLEMCKREKKTAGGRVYEMKNRLFKKTKQKKVQPSLIHVEI